MKYIVHHRFKKLSMSGQRLNIPYGVELEADDQGIIRTTDGNPICFTTSENAKLHFALNDDGCGLERGKLTYAIAYAPRKGDGKFRFTSNERQLLTRHYSSFLRSDTDTILFNEYFFTAPVEKLKQIADALDIKIRR